MTSDRMSAAAEVVVAAIAAAAAVYIMRRPPLRRLAWQVAKYAVGTILPAYLVQETRRAWAESSRNLRAPAIMNG